MSSEPNFSIVTVVYNDLNGLRATCNSILQQVYGSYEWLVIDGASTDGAPAWLSQLEMPQLRYVSESDLGIYDAMNKGRALARGTYTVFLNAGDTFPSEYTLEKVADAIRLHTGVDLLLGAALLQFPNGRTITKRPSPIERYIWHGVPANHQATYFRTSRLAPQPYDLRFHICGDYYLVCRLFKQGVKTIHVNDALVIFRMGDTSFRNPKKLMWEPFIIQREVLHQSRILSCISLIKRAVATLGVFGISLLERQFKA